MTTPRKGLRRVLAAVTSLTLGTAMLVSGASAATAAELGNIDFDADASITVHKHKQHSNQGVNDGTLQEGAGAPNQPLAGIEFSYAPISPTEGVAASEWMKDPANWEALRAGAGAVPENWHTGAQVGPQVTDTAGAVTFNVKPGAYLVTEGNDTSTPGHGIVKKAEPFVVVVPFDNNGSWDYNIHVYPKNSVSKIEKEVDDSTAIVYGNDVKWNITSTAPELSEAQILKRFAVEDTIDSRLEFYRVPPADVDPATVITDVKYDGADLDAADYEVTINGSTVLVELTEAGLAKVKDNSGKALTFTLHTMVKEDVDLGTGVIPNTATQYVNIKNDATEPDGPDTETPSEDPKTHWGRVGIKKVDADNGKVLQGAVFEVYSDEALQNKIGGPITTDADGLATFGPLKAGVVVYFKEITAPAGYVLIDGPIASQPVVAGETVETYQEIANTKQEAPQLPLTGAQGTGLLLGIGGAALLLGLVLARRRNTADDSSVNA